MSDKVNQSAAAGVEKRIQLPEIIRTGDKPRRRDIIDTGTETIRRKLADIELVCGTGKYVDITAVAVDEQSP